MEYKAPPLCYKDFIKYTLAIQKKTTINVLRIRAYNPNIEHYIAEGSLPQT